MEENYIQLNLPSKCLVYEDTDPSKVQIRTLKGRDEKLIAELTYDNFEKKFLTILGSIVKGVVPGKLTVGDRLYIMVWEAINSYSANYPVELMCETCLQKIEITVDLSKLDVIELPEKFKEPHPVKLSDGNQIDLRLFRVEDEVKIADAEKSGKSSWLYRWAISIVDKEKSVWDRINYLENLEAKDVAAIRAFHEKYYHGPKMETEYECPKCGGQGVTPVPFRIELLFPYGKALTKHFGAGV